jgi:hypothetical protein
MNVKETYSSAFHTLAIRLIGFGYSDIKNKVTVNTPEEVITGFLVQAINKKLEEGTLGENYVPFCVNEDIHVNDANALGKSRGRIDIQFEYPSPGERPRYLVEAKRLKSPDFSAKKYLGSEGLGAFVDGFYASAYRTMGMLAYVQSPTYETWRQKLEEEMQIAAYKSCPPAGQHLTPSSHASLDLNAWESFHDRSGVTITVIHVFLNFFE